MSNHPCAPRLRGSCPWGGIDHVEPLGPDAVSVSTPSHGGIWVSPEGLAKIPAELRETAYSPGPWFEEDCDWAIPYAFLELARYEPDLARTQAMRRAALDTLEAFHPKAAELLRARG